MGSLTAPALLVVDDEPILAEFLASVAEAYGWTAEIAVSAGDVEAKIQEIQPDVLALDLAMPGRDGIELLRQLAATQFPGSLIIVSACDEPIVEASAMLAREHGLNVLGYLQKPATALEFASFLERAKAGSAALPLDRRH